MKHQNQKKWFGGIRLMLLTLLCLCASVAMQAQTVQWTGASPSVDRTMINLTPAEYATISIKFAVRIAPVANAKVQVTLPAGVGYVAGSAAVDAGNEAGAITATAAGQVVTFTFTANGGSLLAEKNVALTLRTTATTCAFEDGNVDVKVLSNTTLVANGGQATLLPVSALKPAFVLSPKSAGPSTGTQTNGAAVVAGLANPGTGGAGTDKGTFKINVATTQRTATGLRLTFTVDANTWLENFKLDGTVLATQPTVSGSRVYTLTLPAEVFSTTAKEISFDGYSKYSGAHAITIAYGYGTTAYNCVTQTIASVYSLNYIPVVGAPYFARPTISFVMPNANMLLAPNISSYDIPTDDYTVFYVKQIYRNTGSATAIEVNTACGFSEAGFQFYYIDENEPIYYSIDGGTPQIATTKTYSENMANNNTRHVKAGMTSKRKRVSIVIPDGVPVNATLTVWYPGKGGAIYDHSAKFNTFNSGSCYGFNGTRYTISSKNANGETGGVIPDDSCSGYGNSGYHIFVDVPSAAQIRPLNPTPYSAGFRITTKATNLAAENQYVLMHVKVPPFVEICDAAGVPTNDIKQAVSFVVPPAADNFPVDNLAGGYKVYTLKYDNNAQSSGSFNLNYKAIDNPNPIVYPENTTDTIEFWTDWNMGAATAAQLPYRTKLERVQQTFMPVTLAVEEEGVKILSFNFQRTRKGYRDINNNNIPDDGSEALDEEIVHNRYISHDTGNMIMTAAIKKSGTNTIVNNLYVLLNSPNLPFNAANITLGTANVRIKRNGGYLDRPATPVVASAAHGYYLFKNIALMENDTITVTMPFTFGTGGVLYPAISPVEISAYVDAESTLAPADPYNPENTAGYTKYGKDEFSSDILLYSAYDGDNCCNVQYSRPDNNYFTGYFAMERVWEIAPGYTNEARISTYPKWVEVTIPDGYELGGTYGENLYVNSIQNCTAKTIPFYSREYVATGTKYVYDVSQIYDPAITDANPVAGKCPLPVENSTLYFYNSLKATKGAPVSWTGRAVVKQGEPLLPGQPAEQVLRGSWTTQLVYTGIRITLTTPTTSITANGKGLNIPSVTAGNPNLTNYRMWLYVDGDITNLKAQKLGTMDFPINGTGIDGKWIALGTVPAQTGVDYSLDFDYLNMTYCEGDTIKVWTVYDDGDASYNPTTAAFTSIDGNKVGAFRRIIIKPAPATIISNLTVTPATLIYNAPYRLNVTVDASSSQGILKNDTVTISIPAGQEYVPGSARIAYPVGTETAVSAAVEAALIAHNIDITIPTNFRLSTAEALGDPSFAFDGIASGVDAAHQKAIFTAQFKPMCQTPLTGIRYVAVPYGESSCGQVATGSGRNFRSEVMIADVGNPYGFTVAPVTVSGNRAFNEISKTESLKITVNKNMGSGLPHQSDDSLIVILPKALNVSGAITVTSAITGVPATVPAAQYSNVQTGSTRRIAFQMPNAAINADAVTGYQKDIVYTLSLNFTPDGQAYTINPEQVIDAYVQTNVKFAPACPNAPASIGSGSLGVAFLTALENPSYACLNMNDTLVITTDGFQGKWYKEKTKTTVLPSVENDTKFIYKPKVQLDTTFYVSAIISGTDYGVVPVKVIMNSELKAIISAADACEETSVLKNKVNFTNSTTLGGSAAPAGVTYQWYEWANNAKTPFAGANFTAKAPSLSFPVGKHKVFVIATSPDGCVASSDTINFEVHAIQTPTISGTSPACYNSSEVYTTESGMSNYTWTMSKSNGTDFDGNLSPSTSNTATVSWETPNVVGIISVNYTDLNGCRATAPADYNVIVRNLPPTPALSSGATEVCANSEEMYVVQKITGIKSYNWSISGLGTFTNDGDANDKTATILWGETPGNAVITINHVNNDNCEAEITLTVPVKVKGSARPTINGSATACANGTVRYETAAGMSAYNFVVTGGTYSGVTGSPNAIDVTWGAAGTGTISVSYISDGCPTAMTTPFSVTINARPTLSWQGTPKTTVCVGEVVTYSAPAGKTNYVWTVVGANGYTGGGTTDNSITVTWDDVTSGSVSVNYEDGGCPAVNPLKVNISVSKVVMKATAGASVVCVGSDVTLTNSTAGTKTWRSDNAAIATVDATGKVTGVAAGSSSIWCIVSNAAGCKDSIDHNITVQTATAITTQPTATPSALCPGETVVLTVVAAGQAPLTYQWTKNGSNISGAQGASYTADAAGTYAVTVSGGCGAAVTSNNVSVTAKKATTISVQPQNAAICPTVSATLSVTADGEGTLTYLWKKDGSTAPGTNNAATYSASAEGDYTVEVTGGCGTAVTSSVAVVSEKAATVINTHPKGGAICSGDDIILSVTATGEGTLHYQWKKDGSNVGGDAPTYTATAAGSYTVVITGGCGTGITSNAAVVTVKATTAISTQPAATSAICPGEQATLSVVATGEAPLTYQWKKGGINVAGGNSNSISVSDAGTYTVDVQGACGAAITSSNATVTLKKATEISVQPQSGAICTGDNLPLSVTATGEGTLTYQWKKDGANIGTNSATYSATAAGSYTVTVSGACGTPVTSTAAVVGEKAATVINTHPKGGAICSGDDIILSVTATGEGTLHYQWKQGATNTGGDAPTYTATAAGSYTVVITGGCGTGVTSNAAVVTVKATTVISTQPAATSAICPGEQATLSVVATGEAPLTYQWKKGGINVAGGNSNSISVNDAGTYTVDVQGACGAAITSANAAVTVKKATQINIQPQGGAICAGDNLPLSVSATGEGTLSYQWKKDGVNIGTNAATYSATAAGSYTVEVTGACGLPVLSSAAAVTQKAATSINSQPIGGAICSGSSLTLSVTASGEAPITYAWKKDGAAIGGNSATLNATAAGSYTVDVKGECGAAVTSAAAVITVKPSATISTQPTGGAICAGDNIDLNVVATGEAPLSYQWKKGGVNISGAEAETYTAIEAGSYTVVVTDGCGLTVTSDKATVTLKAATKIVGQPAGGAICAGDNLQLTVTATGEGTLTYQWKKDGAVLSGETNNIYTATAAGSYTVEVQGECGAAVVSDAAVVTQKAPTLISEQPEGASICKGSNLKLTVTASGEGLLTYQWKKDGSNITGANNASYTAADAGSYTVEVTGACGAVTSNAAVIAVEEPTFNLSKTTDAICLGDSYDLSSVIDPSSVTDGNRFGYIVDGVETSNSFVQPQTPGSYSYSIILHSNLCQSEPRIFTLTVRNTPQIHLEGSNLCQGINEIFRAEVYSGETGSGEWHTDKPAIATIDANGEVKPLRPGSFKVFYHFTSDAGCATIVESNTYEVYALPSVKVRDVTVCQGTTLRFADLVTSITNGDAYKVFDDTNTEITTASVVATATATYTIIGTNSATSCETAAGVAVTVTVIDKPTITLTKDNANGTSICLGSTKELADIVTTNLTDYEVLVYKNGNSTPEASSIISPSVSTWYDIQVVSKGDAVCQSGKAPYYVEVGNVEFAKIEDNLNGKGICVGSEATLTTPDVNPAESVRTYEWTSSAPTIISIESYGSGNSAVTVKAQSEGNATLYYTYKSNTASGVCEYKGSKELKTFALPVALITSEQFIICDGTQGAVYAATEGMQNYQWTIDVAKADTATADNKLYVDWKLGNAGTTTISVKFENANGCESNTKTERVTIKANPNPAFAINDASGAAQDKICAGSELLLSPLNYGGVWKVTPSAFASITGNKLTALSTITTTQTVEVRYSLTNSEGCTADSVTTLTLNPLPVASDVKFDILLHDGTTVESGKAASVCQSTVVQVNTDYTKSIVWDITYTDTEIDTHTNHANAIHANLVDKSKRFDVLSVTNRITGCTNADAASLAELGIRINVKSPVKIVEAPVGGGICLPDGTLELTVKVSADATDNLTYVWTNIANATDTLGTDATYTATEAGVYQVKVAGCNADSATATVTAQLPLIVQKRNHTLIANNNASTNGGYNFQYYKWYKDGELLWENLGGASKGGYYYTGGANLSDVDYWVIVKDVNGKEYRSCPFRPVLQVVSTSVQAYPNPTNQAAGTQVYVDVEIDDETQLAGAIIDIYTASGAFIGKVPATGRITSVTLPSVTGVYVLQFKSDAITKEIKIIVE